MQGTGLHTEFYPILHVLYTFYYRSQERSNNYNDLSAGILPQTHSLKHTITNYLTLNADIVVTFSDNCNHQ